MGYARGRIPRPVSGRYAQETMHLHAAGPLLVYIYRLQCSTCVRAAPCIQKIHTRASPRRRKIWIRSPAWPHPRDAPSPPWQARGRAVPRPPAKPLGGWFQPQPPLQAQPPRHPRGPRVRIACVCVAPGLGKGLETQDPLLGSSFGPFSAVFRGFGRSEAGLLSPPRP